IAHITQMRTAPVISPSSSGAYRVVLKGTRPSIPPEFVLPPVHHIDVDRASDAQILEEVAADRRLHEIPCVRPHDSGGFSGSPYVAFLRVIDLPRQPDPGKSDLAYSRRPRSRRRPFLEVIRHAAGQRAPRAPESPLRHPAGRHTHSAR